MVDYKEMYLTLFRATSKAITLLQEAQIQTEELFISSEDTPLLVLDKPNSDNEGDATTSDNAESKIGQDPHFLSASKTCANIQKML